MKEQIPLNFPLRSQATFDSFVVESNGELKARLLNLSKKSLAQTLWLWGASGVGCSHLLYASCHFLHEHNRRVAYIPSKDWDQHSDSLLGYENFDVVAIDDVDIWLNREGVESDLVELYQMLQNSGGILLLSADMPPAQYEYALADLESRFTAAESYEVLGLSDDGKIELVQSLAKQRGINLEAGVARFMLSRCSRQLQDLITILNVLDSESMARQRKVTIPFLKQILDL